MTRPAVDDRTRRTTGARLPMAALALACLAAGSIALGDAVAATDAAEDLGVLVWLAGWVLAVGSALAVVACAAGQVRAARAGRPPTWRAVVVLVLGPGVLAWSAWAHPVAGSGGGSAVRGDGCASALAHAPAPSGLPQLLDRCVLDEDR